MNLYKIASFKDRVLLIANSTGNNKFLLLFMYMLGVYELNYSIYKEYVEIHYLMFRCNECSILYELFSSFFIIPKIAYLKNNKYKIKLNLNNEIQIKWS